MHEIKQRAIVQPDGSIQIYVPELKPGTIAEVIILESSEQVSEKNLPESLVKGKDVIKTQNNNALHKVLE